MDRELAARKHAAQNQSIIPPIPVDIFFTLYESYSVIVPILYPNFKGWSIRIMNWKKAKTLFYRSDSTSHIPFLKKVCNFFIKSLWCTPLSQTYFKICVNFFSCSTNIWIHLFIRLSTYRYLDFISEKKKQFFGRNIFLANNFSDIRHHARYCRIQLQYFFPDERSLKSDISSLLVEKWKYLGFSQILPDLISIFFSRRACWWGIYIIDIHTYIYLIIYL